MGVLCAFSIRVSLLSSKIHNGDDTAKDSYFNCVLLRGELSYLAPLGSENISAPYFKQCFFRGGVVYPPRYATEAHKTGDQHLLGWEYIIAFR